MNTVLFEDKSTWENLLPFTFTRPTAEIRVGILKISEKWERYLNVKVSFVTEEYLSEKYKLHLSKENLYINGAVCPSPELLEAIKNLKNKEVLKKNDVVIAHYDAYIDSAK
ncbi:MAG TPA: putative sugar nucleotidyl transferase, partial [Cytophagales bacterium]|nr:putative sugar nucleotidyl transferase [Cytophagales bacterium]